VRNREANQRTRRRSCEEMRRQRTLLSLVALPMVARRRAEKVRVVRRLSVDLDTAVDRGGGSGG
jgi:hypothetical protein